MQRSSLVAIFLSSFLLGIALGSAWDLPFVLVALMVGGVILILIATWGQERLGRLLGLVLVLVALGMLRASAAGLPPRGVVIPKTMQEFSARIVRVEQGRGGVRTLIFDPSDSNHLILVRSPFLRGNFSVNQEMRVRCQLESLDSRNRFEATYLSQGIVARCIKPKFQPLGQLVPADFLTRLRQRAVRLLDEKLPEPDDAFAASLLLGVRDTLPDSLVRDFRKTGMSHIVAISGANVTLLVGLLSGILSWFLSRRTRLMITTLGIFFFVLLTGASAGTIRAGVMGVLALLLMHLGRKTKPLPAILLVATLMVLISPRLLVYDLSFQLSFLAIIGVLLLGPKIEKRLQSWPDPFSLRHYLAETLGVLVLITPFVALVLKNFTPLALPTNLLVLPLLPLTMGLGVALLLFGQLPLFGIGLAQGLAFLLGTIRWIIHGLASIG